MLDNRQQIIRAYNNRRRIITKGETHEQAKQTTDMMHVIALFDGFKHKDFEGLASPEREVYIMYTDKGWFLVARHHRHLNNKEIDYSQFIGKIVPFDHNIFKWGHKPKGAWTPEELNSTETHNFAEINPYWYQTHCQQ